MPKPEEAKFKPIVEGADALSLGISMVVAVVIGVFILLYSIIQEERVAKKDEPFRGIDK